MPFFQFLFAFYFVKYVPISMGDYRYPAWGEALGFMISLSSMLWVPGNVSGANCQISNFKSNVDNILQAMPSTTSSRLGAPGRRC